jgi:hypothetical protein
MNHRIRLAVMAGVIALAAAACEHDPNGIAAGPGSAPSAQPSSAGPQAVVPSGGGDGTTALPDASSGAMTWYDIEGHRYDVQVGSTQSQHFLDGTLFASVPLSNPGATNVYADGELVVADQPVLYGVPLAAHATGNDAGVVPGDPLGVTHDFLRGRPSRPGEPLRMKVMPCTDQIGSYIVASGELIAAGAYLQRHRGTRAAITAFTAALANWVAAWRELYFCMGR